MKILLLCLIFCLSIFAGADETGKIGRWQEMASPFQEGPVKSDSSFNLKAVYKVLEPADQTSVLSVADRKPEDKPAFHLVAATDGAAVTGNSGVPIPKLRPAVVEGELSSPPLPLLRPASVEDGDTGGEQEGILHAEGGLSSPPAPVTGGDTAGSEPEGGSSSPPAPVAGGDTGGSEPDQLQAVTGGDDKAGGAEDDESKKLPVTGGTAGGEQEGKSSFPPLPKPAPVADGAEGEPGQSQPVADGAEGEPGQSQQPPVAGGAGGEPGQSQQPASVAGGTGGEQDQSQKPVADGTDGTGG